VVVMVMMPVMVMMVVVPEADPDAMMVVMMTDPDGDLGYLGGFFGKPRIVGLQLR
jgi:hypothetical protein